MEITTTKNGGWKWQMVYSITVQRQEGGGYKSHTIVADNETQVRREIDEMYNGDYARMWIDYAE